DERPGLARAVDLDLRAERKRAARAAVGVGLRTRARAVGGLAEGDAGGIGVDEVRRELPAGRDGLNARVDRRLTCGGPSRSGSPGNPREAAWGGGGGPG